MERTTMISNGRNYGIDALRIYSMWMIVVLHVLSQGGILRKISGEGYYLAWWLEIFAYCATNCYALISGYIRNSNEYKHNYCKIAETWLQVLFYSFGITIVFFIFNIGNVSLRDIIESLFPVASTQYWYFTAYVGLFFLMPMLDFLIEYLDKKKCNRFVLLLIAIFSVYGTISKVFGDPFFLGDGYSVLWLCILYFLGAWIKKYNILNRINNKLALLGIFISTITVWCCFCWIPFGGLLISYISPFILFNAIMFLCIFSKINFGLIGKKMIAWISPATFGVYLIHCQKIVFNEYLKNAFEWMLELNIILLPIAVLIVAAVIFILCIFIEKIRIAFFKFLKVKNLINIIYYRMYKFFVKLSKISI